MFKFLFCDALDNLFHVGGSVRQGSHLLYCLGLGEWAVFIAFGQWVSRDRWATIFWGGWGFGMPGATLGIGAGEVVAESEGVRGEGVEVAHVSLSGAGVKDLAR